MPAGRVKDELDRPAIRRKSACPDREGVINKSLKSSDQYVRLGNKGIKMKLLSISLVATAMTLSASGASAAYLSFSGSYQTVNVSGIDNHEILVQHW